MGLRGQCTSASVDMRKAGAGTGAWMHTDGWLACFQRMGYRSSHNEGAVK